MMHNIWALFKSDMKHLFANVVCCIITIGLIVMPSIFAWFNIIACWDVFENTGDLKVAVANEDEGYESDLIPLRVNVGDMVVSALRANDQIGWVITDEADAVDGASSGQYYAAVVIPKEFSRDMLRFYADDSQRAQITYYANEKKNAISPKITSTGADTVSLEVNSVFAQSISEVMLSVAKSVSKYADEADVQGQIAVLADHADSMSQDMGRVADVMGIYSSTIESVKTLIDDAATLITQAKNQVSSMADAANGTLSNLSGASEIIGQAESEIQQAISSAKQRFDDLGNMISESGIDRLIDPDALALINQSVADAKSKIQAMQDDYNANIKPNLDRMASDSQALVADASKAIDDLKAAEEGVSSATDSVRGVLDDAMSQIDGVVAQLRTSADTLHDLATRISEALAAGDSQALQELIGSDAQTLSQALATPVGIDRVALYPSENFGSAMAPFYTTLAVFIGSLLILVVIKPNVSNRAQKKLRNPKPRQLLLGRFGSLACVSLAQTTLMGLGNIFFLQVQAVHPFMLMLALWFAGLVFTFIIYVLVLAFANLGKAISVCLLIVQVTGCGGSYPLQILPDFVQQLSPFLPATHVVDAMRSAMFGIYHGDYWVQMGELALFLIPAIIIGFALRKPFERFMKWYVHTVEETKIVG